ncbi:hypothetical protein EJ04DRAFT_516361 [Polyplosphaeria fusca]|uniref:Uncharacterized protein n=1 Tax=Polyplosphaeria fusca TaxID=682080 RepID=A0A9P4QLN5_9PLEO|nr:hypothetical protein EJ04DRAFT_516361 [Polyplosphaeria fusca]
MSYTVDTDSSKEASKVSIILKDTSDWRNWFQYQKELAGAKGIWKYVNPDGPDEFDKAHQEPIEPTIEEYAEAEKAKRAAAAAAAASAANNQDTDGDDVNTIAATVSALVS